MLPQAIVNMKTLWIGFTWFKVKPINPGDFLEIDDGVPFYLFQLKNSPGNNPGDGVNNKRLNKVFNDAGYKFPERPNTNNQNADNIIHENIDKAHEHYINILSKTVLTKNWRRIKDYHSFYFDMLNKNPNKMSALIFNIVQMSMIMVKKKTIDLIKMNKGDVLFIDAIAKRYGQTPIDIVAPDTGYSALDSYMFNKFVASVGFKNEWEQQAKQIAEMKRGGRKR
jgi:hypothetical protein